MADCVLLEKCPFFSGGMQDMPGHAELFRELYCRGGHDICARHMIFQRLGHEAVPKDLFPNEVSRANAIIADSRKLAKKA